MKVLVTGASGFVGRNLILRAPADWKVTALYASDSTFEAFVERLDGAHVTAVRCHLGNPDDVAAFSRAHGAQWDACVYLAGKVDIPWSVASPRDDLLANVVPLLNLLEQIHVGKFLYFSSGAVYDGMSGEVEPDAPVAPTLPYAVSKLASERYVHFFRRRRQSIGRFLIVRFFGAYGPYEAPHKIYTRLVRAFAFDRQSRYTIYGDGTNLIDAMYIDDAVDAIRRMLAGDHWDLTVNLAAGHPLPIEELVREVAAALGVPGVQIDKSGIANEKNEFWGSMRQVRALYGFQPSVPLADGVCRFRDHLSTLNAPR